MMNISRGVKEKNQSKRKEPAPICISKLETPTNKLLLICLLMNIYPEVVKKRISQKEKRISAPICMSKLETPTNKLIIPSYNTLPSDESIQRC